MDSAGVGVDDGGGRGPVRGDLENDGASVEDGRVSAGEREGRHGWA